MADLQKLKFTKTHEWVAEEGDKVKVGLTDHAQDLLGDIVFVDLPSEGDGVTVGDSFTDVESVKAVSEVYSPVTGTIAAVNEELEDTPEAINSAPYDTWIIEVEGVEEREELLSFDEYQKFCEEEEA